MTQQQAPQKAKSREERLAEAQRIVKQYEGTLKQQLQVQRDLPAKIRFSRTMCHKYAEIARQIEDELTVEAKRATERAQDPKKPIDLGRLGTVDLSNLRIPPRYSEKPAKPGAAEKSKA